MSIDDIEFFRAFGFDSFFEQQLYERNLDRFKIARIVHEEKNLFRIQCSNSESRWAELSGRFYHGVQSALDLPAVGDWIAYLPMPGTDRALIHHVFTRKTCLYRTAVGGATEEQILGANVDRAFVMTSLNHDLNPKRLERYFVLCLDSGVEPVLVLTKRDLMGEVEYAVTVKELTDLFPAIRIAGISITSGCGLSELESFMIPGKTIALLGSSGVGKSSLTNHLMANEVLATQSVRAGDDKGRHTTSGRHLFLLPQGGLMMDTPGMRELQLFQSQNGLSEVFEDIERLIIRCKFSNCAHQSEPDCAVRAALEDETLAKNRWTNYQKLQREQAFQARKLDKIAQSSEKERWKKISKYQRQVGKTRY